MRSRTLSPMALFEYTTVHVDFQCVSKFEQAKLPKCGRGDDESLSLKLITVIHSSAADKIPLTFNELNVKQRMTQAHLLYLWKTIHLRPFA